MPEIIQIENWKPIRGYEGLYEVSDFARVKSLRSGNILRGTCGRYYHVVVLCKDKQQRRHYVHRLVADRFVSGHFDGAVVNHLDCNKRNNLPSNLEWCTQSHNNTHATLNGRRRQNLNTKYKVLDTATGELFTSIRHASKSRNITYTYLAYMLRGKKRNRTSLVLAPNHKAA